ncbi:MAG: hypothetical protein II264_04555 [Ruminococcus sp.]|nr:hypothetical protein [Ruminococcus sp.]
MGKQSGFLKQQKELRRVLLHQNQHIERQRCMDCMQIAMRRLGYSFTQIKKISEKFMETVDEFSPALQGDNNPDADYYRVKMDEALSEFIAPHQEFVPFEKRYPYLRTINPITGKLED